MVAISSNLEAFKNQGTIPTQDRAIQYPPNRDAKINANCPSHFKTTNQGTHTAKPIKRSAADCIPYP